MQGSMSGINRFLSRREKRSTGSYHQKDAKVSSNVLSSPPPYYATRNHELLLSALWLLLLLLS